MIECEARFLEDNFYIANAPFRLLLNAADWIKRLRIYAYLTCDVDKISCADSV
jgi:hypothetical protein